MWNTQDQKDIIVQIELRQVNMKSKKKKKYKNIMSGLELIKKHKRET